MKNGLKISLLTLAILSNQAIKPMRITRTIETATNAFNKRVQEYEREAVKEPLKEADYTQFKADISAIINSLRPFKESSAIAKIAAFEKKLKDIETARTQKQAAEKFRSDLKKTMNDIEANFKVNFEDKLTGRIKLADGYDIILEARIGHYADNVETLANKLQQNEQSFQPKEFETLLKIDIPNAHEQLGILQQKYLAKSLSWIASFYSDFAREIDAYREGKKGPDKWPDNWSNLGSPLSVVPVFDIGKGSSEKTYDAAAGSQESKDVTGTVNYLIDQMAAALEAINRYTQDDTISPSVRLNLTKGIWLRDPQSKEWIPAETFIDGELISIHKNEFKITAKQSNRISDASAKNEQNKKNLEKLEKQRKQQLQLGAPTQQQQQLQQQQQQLQQQQLQQQKLMQQQQQLGPIKQLEELGLRLHSFLSSLSGVGKDTAIDFKFLEKIQNNLDDINELDIDEKYLKTLTKDLPEYTNILKYYDDIIKNALAIIKIVIDHTLNLDKSIATSLYKNDILSNCNAIIDLVDNIADKSLEELGLMKHEQLSNYTKDITQLINQKKNRTFSV